jgi:hypothetical protein
MFRIGGHHTQPRFFAIAPESVMEIHHSDDHTRRRSLKSFAFEFLMISIAVFVGSLGECFLDHRIIDERLQNSLVSMRDDLETDLRSAI